MLKSLQIKKLDARIGNEFPTPSYATSGSAGLDLLACIPESLVIKAGKAVLVATGLSIFINDPQYAALILPRSGNGHKKGLVVGNLVGLIDSDYQGQLMVSCWNRNHDIDIVIEPGDKVAQLIIVPVLQVDLDFVEEFTNSTERGEGGFGSTGSK